MSRRYDTTVSFVLIDGKVQMNVGRGPHRHRLVNGYKEKVIGEGSVFYKRIQYCDTRGCNYERECSEWLPGYIPRTKWR